MTGTEKETDYTEFYAGITKRIRQCPNGIGMVRAADRILTGFMYAVYPCLLLYLLITSGWREVLPYILIPGISFIAVSAVRDRLDRRRPYEEWPIDPLIHKNTKGHSMPSRHVFSSAIISMCALTLNPAAGVVLLILTMCSAVIRVLGGVHYPKDVAAGMIIGAVAGSILFLF